MIYYFILFYAGVNYGHFCETDPCVVYMTAHIHVACDTRVQGDYCSMTAVISIFHSTVPLRRSLLWERAFWVDEAGLLNGLHTMM